jgi:hypothetical protein
MRKEDAGGGLGHAKEDDRAPQVEAGEAEGGVAELGCQETVAADATADARVRAEAGPARTEEAVAMGVVVPCLATDEVAVGEVVTAEASSGQARQEDPREVAGEAMKEASTGMRTSEPPKVVAQASSNPVPVPGMKADMPAPGTEIGATADPPLFGAASGSEKVSQGAHTARAMESDRSKASTTPRAAAKGALGEDPHGFDQVLC